MQKEAIWIAKQICLSLFLFSSLKTQLESLPEPNEIGTLIEEVDLSKQINSEVDSDDVQELLYFYNQELTIELKEMHDDEAHFWLNGYVNKQNCRIWSEANPQVYVETPLHPEKLTVWSTLWAGGILLLKR
ncbi:hypothetical protein TNCV_4915891 [Trichonephila clavipes]|nr:hypothetical protein TNCV_4915891 [Trichonephila clavipes]